MQWDGIWRDLAIVVLLYVIVMGIILWALGVLGVCYA